MQLTNSATIVDFYPEAFIAEACEDKGVKTTIRRFVKCVTFRATGQKSYSVVGMIDAKNEWAERIAKGAEVTGFRIEKFDNYAEYRPLMC